MKILIKLFNQPLIQFLLLGAVIFFIDWKIVGNQDDPHRIIIDDEKYQEIAGIFKDNQGRPPSEKEMEVLTIKWAQNELLYREARMMRLDKGDEMIRQRLILKFRNVLFNKVVTEAPTEETLKNWFEQNRKAYDKPVRVDFEQFQLTDQYGKQEANELAIQLGMTDAPEKWTDKLRRYHNRPISNLETVFDNKDAEQLILSQDNRWVAVQSKSGWHLSRITSRIPGEPAEYKNIRKRVLEDWKAKETQAELGAALQTIASDYDIRIRLTTTPMNLDPQNIVEERLAKGDFN